MDGVPVTTVARTMVDLARALPLRDGLVAMDAALHSGQVTQEQLRAVLDQCRRWPWIRRAAQAVALSDAAAESALESSRGGALLAQGVDAGYLVVAQPESEDVEVRREPLPLR